MAMALGTDRQAANGITTTSTDQVKVQMAKYPCPESSATDAERGFWFSEFLPTSDPSKEIVFKVEFGNISRMKAVTIQWLFLPDEIKIEYYTDPKLMVWDVAKGWYRLQAAV